MPFRAGEILNYRVTWAAFSNAASVDLTCSGASQSLWLRDLAFPRPGPHDQTRAQPFFTWTISSIPTPTRLRSKAANSRLH